jgi:SAM-dependent methyltransferase
MPSAQVEQPVQDYFNKCAERFDSFYREEEKRTAFQQLAHVVFRKPGLVRRFQETIKALGNVEGKSILDIGCGSGLYSIYFAQRGANVTGVDFSSRMIELAERNAKDQSCSSVRFLNRDFLSFQSDEKFDHLLFIGVFDYVKEDDRRTYLSKGAELAGDKIVATFPKLFTPQMPIRYYWLKQQDCPVYFYTRGQIESLAAACGLRPTFHDCGPIWAIEFQK